MTLAIETSCDDTSVAIVELGVAAGRTVARLHFHAKVTSNNHVFQGVHPLLTLKSHQENLAPLVAHAIEHLPVHAGARRLPDLISVTRGPGMRSNLMCGLDTAKGLAVAWNRPLVGVHHMQAHALTPRLVAALDAYQSLAVADAPNAPAAIHVSPAPAAIHVSPAPAAIHVSPAPAAIHVSPAFPLLSVLASGGHTLLIHSASLTAHTVLATTDDIAVGECLDKSARAILPPESMAGAKSTMYGALLEAFAFPDATPVPRGPDGLTATQYLRAHTTHAWYTPPPNPGAALARSKSQWAWSLAPPLLTSAGGAKLNSSAMSFSGLTAAVERLARFPTDPLTGKLSSVPRADIPMDERRALARAVQRAAFEHIASRVVRALSTHSSSPTPAVVMAGGVASNAFLRHVLASTLAFHGHGDAPLFFPPPEYCTDNAAMIGWAGLEMYHAGYSDDLAIRAVKKWPLDELLAPRVVDRM